MQQRPRRHTHRREQRPAASGNARNNAVAQLFIAQLNYISKLSNYKLILSPSEYFFLKCLIYI